MRVLTLAVCGVLLTTSLAVAASSDRAALLDRLRLALPNFSEMVPLADMFSADKRKALIAQNPGKDSVVGPITDRYGTCLADVLKSRDPNAEAVAAADRSGMTDADLLKVIAFYEDPVMREFFATIGPALKSGKEPELDPAKFERVQAGMQVPAVGQFSQIIRKGSQDMLKDPVISQKLAACGAALDRAVTAAGLAPAKS
jgi:hypothetical protein